MWTKKRVLSPLFHDRRHEGSVPIALLMVVVSVVTGPVTYLVASHVTKAAVTDDTGIREGIERGYLGGSIQSLIDHEERLFENYLRHDALHTAHMDAMATAGNDPSHEFGAQSEHDQSLAVAGGFVWGFPAPNADDVLEYPADNARASLVEATERGRLHELTPRKISTESADADRALALNLVKAIVALVIALVLLTGAQMTRRLRAILTVAGTVLAVAALGFAASIDPDRVSRWTLILAVAAIAAIALSTNPRTIRTFSTGSRTIRTFYRRAIHEETSPEMLPVDTGAVGPPHAAIPHPGELGSYFTRIVAMAIAFATFLGAWIGYLQTDAFASADAYRFEARSDGVEALTALDQDLGEALHQIERHSLATENDVAIWGGKQFARYQEANGSAGDHHGAMTQLDHLTMTADATTRLDEVSHSPYGPADDPAYPNALLANAAREHDRLTALELLSDAGAVHWTKRAAYYVRLLVILAIAVYLLGLAVVLRGRSVKLLLSVSGVGFMGVALVAAIWTLANHPGPKPTDRAPAEEAAKWYSEGRFAFATGDYDAAARAFEQATVARDDFGPAYAEWADAAYLSGTSQTSAYVSITNKDALNVAVAQHQHAIENEATSFAVQTNLGNEEFLMALLAGPGEVRDGYLKKSLASTGEAIKLLRADPLPRFNLAVAHLAAGDKPAAEAAYTAAIERLKPGSGQSDVHRIALLSAALSDLEVVRKAMPERDADIDAAQARLITELSGSEPLSGKGISKSEVTIEILPTTLVWTSRLAGYPTGPQTLQQVWFSRAASDEAWSVDGDVATLDPDATRAGGSFVVLFPPSEDDSGYSGEFDFAVPRQGCLPAREYRVDLYVNGVLAGRSEPKMRRPSDAGAATTTWWPRDIGLLGCIPPDWKRVTNPASQAGLFDAVESPDRKRGLLFARIHYAGATEGPDRAIAVLDWIRQTGLGIVPAGLESDADFSHPDAFFLGPVDDRTQLWRSSTTEYRAQAETTLEGTVLVAILFGPRGFLESDDARVDSIGRSYVEMDELWGLRLPQ